MPPTHRGLIHDREPRLPLRAVIAAIFGGAAAADCRRLDRLDIAAVYAVKHHQIENPTLWFLAALNAGAEAGGES